MAFSLAGRGRLLWATQCHFRAYFKLCRAKAVVWRRPSRWFEAVVPPPN
jgi:hypothetical protein